ncbi:MAG: hypothetical protein B6I22_09295 [Desulfobacteraceae bacterium 4572_123]|nr:MAG: hypothetical protein B6I22_09295 [Desulfobacteraceae bacterium 4572_123]
METWHTIFNKLTELLDAKTTWPGIFVKTLIVLAVTFTVWVIIKKVLSVVAKRIKKLNLFDINDELFFIIRKSVRYFLILIAGTYLIRLFGITFLEKAFHALLIILIAAPVKNFLIITLSYLESSIAEKTETKVDNIIFDLLNKFAGVIVYAFAIVLALDLLGINVMPFIAGAGILGVAIGFAAKDTLSNLIAGVLLIIDRPFEIGDRIEVWSAPAGSSTWGDVIDIGLRATKIKTTDNIVIIIPNNEIMTRDIVNYTIISSKIRVRINIGIAYESDLETAKAAILRIAETVTWVVKNPGPKVVVRNFGESSVDLQLRVWIHDARKRMDTISMITDKVKGEFDKSGIEIPYPKRNITIIQKNI